MILTMVAMLMMTTAFAENENTTEVSNLEAYDMNINMNKLSNALNLSEDQKEAVENIHHQFSQEMMMAATADIDEREALVDQAVKKDVRYMHYVLNDKQYKTYLMLLNATLQNRGLK